MSDDTPKPAADEPENPELDPIDEDYDPALFDLDPEDEDEVFPPVPRPINWDLLPAEDAEHEWLTLNEWVHWLRKTYALPASIIPPAWHRHPELVW